MNHTAYFSFRKAISLALALVMLLSLMPLTLFSFEANTAKAYNDPNHPTITPKDTTAHTTNVTGAQTGSTKYEQGYRVNGKVEYGRAPGMDGIPSGATKLDGTWRVVFGNAPAGADYTKIGLPVASVRQDDSPGTAIIRDQDVVVWVYRSENNVPIYSRPNGTGGDVYAGYYAGQLSPRSSNWVVAKPGDRDREGKEIKAGDTVHFYNWYTGEYLGTSTAGEYIEVPTKAYNVFAMAAFATLHPGNSAPKELIDGNDCTNFISNCLIAGNLPWYSVYAGGGHSGRRANLELLKLIQKDGETVYNGNWNILDESGNPSGVNNDMWITWPDSYSQKLYPGDVIYLGDAWPGDGHMMVAIDSRVVNGVYQVHIVGHSAQSKTTITQVRMLFHASQYRIDVLVEESKGNLEVTKVDARDSSKKLSGATFRLTGSSVTYGPVDKTTGSDGKASWTDIPAGTYTLQEITAPTGYYAVTSSKTVTVTSGNTTTETITNNQITGKVTVYKYRDAQYPHGGTTQQPLSGAVVRICNTGTTTAAKDWNGNTLPDKTTGTDGAVGTAWDNIPYGTYDIVEITAPEGYQNAGKLLTFSITTAGQQVVYNPATVNAPIYGRVGVKKIRADDSNEAVPGVKFELLNADKSARAHDIYDTETPVITTDTQGVANWNNVEYGTYWIHEIETADGYYLDPTADSSYQQVTITNQNDSPVATFQAGNIAQQWEIKLQKEDILTREPLSGIVFDVTRVSGLDYNKTGRTQSWVMTTDAEGKASLPNTSGLTTGVYHIKERVPAGDNAHYSKTTLLDTDFTLSSTDRTKLTFTYDFGMVENQPNKGKALVIKKDSLTDNPIPGITFEVYKYYEKRGDATPVYGNPDTGLTVFEKTDYPTYVCDITTDANGLALSPEIEKGCYYIVEKQPTPGYLFEKVEFDEVMVYSDETTTLTAVNKPVQIDIKIYKRDVEEYTGEEPETASQTVGGDQTYEWIVGPDRTWTQTTTLPVAKEIQAVNNRGDGVVTGAKFKVVAGADIKDRQGNVKFASGATVIESLETAGDDASVSTGPLWPGVYQITEIAAPEGYRSSDEVITVDTTSAAEQSFIETVEYQALKKNKIKEANLELIKFLGDNEIHTGNTSTEKPEKGAVFEVYLAKAGSYDAAREYERDIVTTNEKGRCITKMLPYGTYTVHQISGEYAHAMIEPFNEEMTEDMKLYQEIINNFKQRAYLQIIKVDEETGNTITLAGTQFKLKDSEGNFITQTQKTPNIHEIDTFITDETGKTTLPETIACGTYYITEIKTPEGYLIRGDDFEVNMTPTKLADEGVLEATGELVLPVDVPNVPVKGHIQVDKYGKQLIGFQKKTSSGFEYNQPIFEERFLAGCVFEIYAAEDIDGKEGTHWYDKDELVDTITTTANGADENPLELPLGKYYVIEKSAPAGYLIDENRYDVELKYKDDQTRIVTEKIEAGNRYLPVDLSAVKVKTHIVPDEQDTGMIHQKEVILPAEGFVFGLFNKNALTPLDEEPLDADSCLTVMVSDADGLIGFTGYMPHGEYYIKELKAVDGWHLNESQFDLSLTPDHKAADEDVIIGIVPDEIVDEEIHYPVTITKTTITGDETVPGALIEVYDENGTIVYREYTDDNGEIPDIELVPGKYTFKEILAPEGYELNVAILEFEVKDDGEIIGHTTITDDYTRVQFTKVDAMDGEPLEGIEFTLFDKEHNAIMTAESDEYGLVVFEKIPYGEFTIEETKTLDGYDKREGSICKAFVVDGTFVNSKGEPPVVKNEPNTFFGMKVDQDNKPLAGATFGLYDADGKLLKTAESDENGRFEFRKLTKGKYTIKEITPPSDAYLVSRKIVELEIEENTQSPKEPVGTWVNKLKKVEYIKVDTSGKYLEGVEFSLIDKETGKVVEVVKSDANGVFVFTKFDYGTWIVRETKAPEGYNIIADMEFVVDDDWKQPAPVKCVDIPNHYEFVKTDTAGNPLAGVRFSLEDKDGNKLGDYVSDDNGIVKVTDLKPGKYVIKEIEAPSGFLRTDENIEVVIDEKYVVPEEMYHLCNIPNHYEFVKTDNKGRPLAGVKFTLEDANGTILGQYVSAADGIVRVTDLQKGKYVIREIQTLEGYVKTDEAIVVEINEKYIVPKEMYRLINYPRIKTGVELSNPLLWVGVGVLVLAIAGGSVLIVRKKRSTAK